MGIDATENCKEQRYVLNDKFIRTFVEVDSVAYVKRMLDKEENTRSKNFLCTDAKDEGKGQQRRSCCGESCDERGV